MCQNGVKSKLQNLHWMFEAKTTITWPQLGNDGYKLKQSSAMPGLFQFPWNDIPCFSQNPWVRCVRWGFALWKGWVGTHSETLIDPKGPKDLPPPLPPTGNPAPSPLLGTISVKAFSNILKSPTPIPVPSCNNVTELEQGIEISAIPSLHSKFTSSHISIKI